MHVDLTPNLVGQQSAGLIEHGDGAFIAGGLNGEDTHGGRAVSPAPNATQGLRRNAFCVFSRLSLESRPEVKRLIAESTS
jgi:hypothetical protein